MSYTLYIIFITYLSHWHESNKTKIHVGNINKVDIQCCFPLIVWKTWAIEQSVVDHTMTTDIHFYFDENSPISSYRISWRGFCYHGFQSWWDGSDNLFQWARGSICVFLLLNLASQNRNKSEMPLLYNTTSHT